MVGSIDKKATVLVSRAKHAKRLIFLTRQKLTERIRGPGYSVNRYLCR
jgi:hypothetical protein